jgi:hypothetical protein
VTVYRVQMVKSPGLTDIEISRRLQLVYSLLIRLGKEHKRETVRLGGPDGADSDTNARVVSSRTFYTGNPRKSS